MATPNESSARAAEQSAELMSAYLDAELDPAETAQFERYLDESPEARDELEDLRKMMKLVGSLRPVEAPHDFFEKLSRRLRRRQGLHRDLGLLSLVTLPFQVICIIVILTIAALHMMAQLEETPQAVERDPASDVQRDSDTDAPLPVVP
ncbi:MAG: zf-HC2 domain-containing protein [Deltaproteobacteria bacterium]|nr:zf-HC2 domain-containing protein [Nannocystaceae bacterium]